MKRVERERRSMRRGMAALLVLAAALQLPALARATTFHTGDVAWSIGGGKVLHLNSSGGLVETLDTGSGTETSGLIFDGSHDLIATSQASGGSASIARFTPAGRRDISLPNTNDVPSDVKVDWQGSILVGDTGFPRPDLLAFEPDGTPHAAYTFPDGNGPQFFDLRGDQRTVLYDGNNYAISRFDLITSAPGDDWVSSSSGVLTGFPAGLRVLPDGSVLVAEGTDVVRIDGSGSLRLRVWDTGLQSAQWVDVAPTADGQGFWATLVDSGVPKLYKFSLAQGPDPVQGPISAPGGSSTGRPMVAVDTGALPPAPTAAPTNTAPPTLSGTVAVGAVVTCTSGSWTGSPTLAYGWLRDGVLLGGAVASTYTVTPDDAGHTLACRVIATNAGGSASASSAGAAIPAPPQQLATPTVSGGATPGQVLTCNPGTWTNTPSYGFRWLRDYAPIPGAVGSSYAVQNEDVDHTLACEVTAFNNGGSQTATSNAVSVTASGGTGGDGGTGVAPTNTAGPSISIADRLLTCHAGTWTGNPSYSYQWLRDGIEIGGAIAVTYTVKDADDGHAISCRVTASNAGGGASATSGVVNVHISAATPPQATVTVATTQDLLLVVNRGSMPVKVSCVTGCTISSVLTGRLPAQSAGRWRGRGLATTPVWARGSGVLTKKGIARILLHLTPAARKRFKHYKVLHLKLVTTVKLKNGKTVVRTKLVTLRR